MNAEMVRLEALDQFRQAEEAMMSILSMPEAFETTSEIPDRNLSHRLARDELLERLADRYSVDRNEIIERNKLIFPYIDSSQSAAESKLNGSYQIGVRYIGDPLLIPQVSGFVHTSLMTETEQERAFGVDFLLEFDPDDESFDLVESDDDADCRMVSGIAAVQQSIRVMLGTQPGRLIDYKAFGLPVQPGKKMDMFQINLDRFKLQQALMLDSRVSQARVTQIKGKNGAYQYEYEITLKDGQSFKDIL